MATNEPVQITKGYYLDPSRNGYKLLGVAPNEDEPTAPHLAVYQRVADNGKTIGNQLYYSQAGVFASKVTVAKGFKYFAQLSRLLGLSPEPGSRTDKKA